jgi:solute carrier family 25 aspartate/glutamate transporter 12/13
MGALAGASAGLCQLVITNPMEIVKIRLQTSTEKGSRGSLGHVVKELGLRGLFTGVSRP